MNGELAIHPLTRERWDDLCALFGPGGSCSGCWCMWWRVPNKEFHEGELNREAFRRVVEAGPAPGLLGYHEGEPVGWVSLGPRSDFRRFQSMRKNTFVAVDEKPVWSIVCFYVHAKRRGMGVARTMLRGAIEYARAQGVSTLEAYPNDIQGRGSPVSVFMGTPALYAEAGFVEVLRREPTRPILRLEMSKLVPE